MPAIVSAETLVDPATFYREQGYYVARGLFDGATMSGLSEDFDRIVGQILRRGEGAANARWSGEENDRLSPGSVVLHTHNVHMYAERWARVWQDARFLDVVEALIGPDIILHHTKLFQKPAERGAAFPTHQDWPYFPSRGNSLVAGILHVSPATDAMGCLRLFPGSHREGRLDGSQGQGKRTLFQERFPLERAMPVEAESGDVAFFSCLTVHGSMPNRSQRVRRTVLCQCYAGDDRPEANGHPDHRLVLRGWNHAMDRERANA